jgi:hypothetical protein
MQNTLSTSAQQLFREHEEKTEKRGGYGWPVQMFTFPTKITGQQRVKENVVRNTRAASTCLVDSDDEDNDENEEFTADP